MANEKKTEKKRSGRTAKNSARVNELQEQKEIVSTDGESKSPKSTFYIVGIGASAGGLEAVKRCGGIAVVQDPRDAVAPDMPLSAIDNVAVDYILPLAKMGETLQRLVHEKPSKNSDTPEDLHVEARIAEEATLDMHQVEQLGTPAPLQCPECGGGSGI